MNSRSKFIKFILAAAFACCFLAGGKQPAQAKRVNTFAHTNARHKNLRPRLLYRIKGLRPNVVQKHYQDGKYMYALQVSFNNVFVDRARIPRRGHTIKFKKRTPELEIRGGGHTQTWEKAGNDRWFVGVTPKHSPHSRFYWTTEIGRVKFGNSTYQNSQIPRLTDINAASDDPNYSSSQVKRVEAAASPNRKYLLIYSLQRPDRSHLATMHFGLYNMDLINQKLDAVENSDNPVVSLKDIEPLAAFHLKDVYGQAPGAIIRSLQGLEIDNHQNIYISSQSPCSRTTKKIRVKVKPARRRKGKKKARPKYKHFIEVHNHSAYPRELIRIANGSTNPHNWVYAKVNYPAWKKWATELEGIQIRGHNVYLSVACHDLKALTPVRNYIFKAAKFVR